MNLGLLRLIFPHVKKGGNMSKIVLSSGHHLQRKKDLFILTVQRNRVISDLRIFSNCCKIMHHLKIPYSLTARMNRSSTKKSRPDLLESRDDLTPQL